MRDLREPSAAADPPEAANSPERRGIAHDCFPAEPEPQRVMLKSGRSRRLSFVGTSFMKFDELCQAMERD